MPDGNLQSIKMDGRLDDVGQLSEVLQIWIDRQPSDEDLDKTQDIYELPIAEDVVCDFSGCVVDYNNVDYYTNIMTAACSFTGKTIILITYTYSTLYISSLTASTVDAIFTTSTNIIPSIKLTTTTTSIVPSLLATINTKDIVITSSTTVIPSITWSTTSSIVTSSLATISTNDIVITSSTTVIPSITWNTTSSIETFTSNTVRATTANPTS